MSSFIKFRQAWVTATTLGFMVFLLMIPISFIYLLTFPPPELSGMSLAQMLQQSSGIGPLDYGRSFYLGLLAGHFMHYLIVGVILGWLQYRVLREFIPNKLVWIIMTVIGLELILVGDFFYPGLSTGGAPGPLEPLLIALGGGGLVAVMQYLYLRSLGITQGKWTGRWILGIITGIVCSVPFIFLYEYFIREKIQNDSLAFMVIDWLSFILPYFTLIGFFAGLFSAKPLYKALLSQKI